ncbi:hypothetical protein [Streptomyces sp. WAC06128]|uniref:hypothetical protein n=1 Tax=Streptomyces sp. WAC06128 TaxID=2487426 RepID=UPI000FB3D4A8|nr:hypothetical protein [Streptomyces sp. WAC06128]RSS67632.1 hypothetical protein EF911_34375 [Streptomyces sp. WAC06128]
MSVYQLERWRAAGHLPRHPRRGLGRGRGTRAELLPATVERAELLTRSARQGRAVESVLTTGLDQSLREDSPAALRRVVIGHLHRRVAVFGVEPQFLSGADMSEETWDEQAETVLQATADRARRSQPPPETHNLLRDLAQQRGLDVEGVARIPRWQEVRPLLAVILRVFTGGPGAVGLEEIAEAVGAGLRLPEPLVKEMKTTFAAQELAQADRGETPHVLSGYLEGAQALITAVECADDEALMRAAAVVRLTTQYQMLALLCSLAALRVAPAMPLRMEPEGVVRMLQHPVWICWGQTLSRATATREESLAVLIAEALDPRQPGNTDELLNYLRFLRVELGLPDEDVLSGSFGDPVVQPDVACPGQRMDPRQA